MHRDIKPSNLILDAEGRLRILDFGLARLEGHETLTLSGDLMGSVLYMSPEQATAKRIPLDHRTDVYSLGATMYEVLTGRPPFKGKDQHDTLSQIIARDTVDPRSINPRIPEDLETIVLKCLRKDAGDRYGTADALARDLRRFVEGDAVEALPESRWSKWKRRLRRNKTHVAVASVSTLLAIALSFHWINVQPRLSDAEYVLLVSDARGFLQRDGLIERYHHGSLRDDVLPLTSAADRLTALFNDLENAIATYPRRPEALYYRALALWRVGRLQESREQLDQLIVSHPAYSEARKLRDVVVEEKARDTKLARDNCPDGVWSTYFGGSGTDEVAHSHLLPDGNIVVVGSTDSSDFPVRFIGGKASESHPGNLLVRECSQAVSVDGAGVVVHRS